MRSAIFASLFVFSTVFLSGVVVTAGNPRAPNFLHAFHVDETPSSLTVGSSSNDVVIGTYLPNWFVYRKHYMGIENIGADPNVEVGDPTDNDQQWCYFGSDMKAIAPKITHIYYAFFNLDQDCKVRDADPAASWWAGKPQWIHNPSNACKGLLNQLMSLKTEYPHLSIVISVGGWTYSQWFSKCAMTSEGRDKMYKTFDFYASAMDNNWGKSNGRIAGVDFDWEHPATDDGFHPDHDDSDWVNYVELVKSFRANAGLAGRNKVQISAAIGVGKTLTRLVEEFPQAGKDFCNNVDHVNLMTYDLWGKWNWTTGHNAQFCRDDNPNARPEQSLMWSVKEVTERLAQVCDYKKIMLGLPNYAPAWTEIPDNGVHGLYQNSNNAASFAKWSTFSDDDKKLVPQGQIHYWDMKQTMSKYSDIKLYTSHTCTDLGVTVPVKYVYSSQRQIFASFEPADVVQAKAQWAKARGLGGFFFWDASQDKNGETLDAARTGWGSLPTFSATGSKQCYDSNAPDFSVEPDTGKALVDGCFTNVAKSYTLVKGDTCGQLKTTLVAKCPSTNQVIAVGGKHNGGQQCQMVCGTSFGAGDVDAYIGDVVYYVCSLDELNGGSSDGDNNDNNNNNGGSNGDHSIDCASSRTFTVERDDTCDSIGIKARAVCGGQAYFTGATRVAAQQTCENTCSSTWGPGTTDLWALDVVHYECGGDSNNSDNGSSDTGADGENTDNGGNSDNGNGDFAMDCSSSKTITVEQGMDCPTLGSQASAACGGQAYFGGATRSAASVTCELVCSQLWGPGSTGIWAEDVVHYYCDPNNSGNNNDNDKGNSDDLPAHDGIGTDCQSCSACVAGKNNQQIFDADCAQCLDGIPWWPCNVQGACHCP